MRRFKPKKEGEKRAALPVNDMNVQLAMGEVKDRGLRNYEVEKDNTTDKTLLQYQLAVFYKNNNTILKLSCLDIRGLRFDCSERKKTRFVNFKDGILFNFTDEGEFNKYYALYVLNNEKPESAEKLLKWLGQGSDLTTETLDTTT